jgi:predicted alpha/beta superfamily hydrolase
VYVPAVGWEPYAGATVVGDVRVLRGAVDRDLYVYVPPTPGPHPVVYMHDAQNLFDEALSNSGEWRVDETMEELAREGLSAIVAGIPHGGDLRGHELAGDGADEYLSLLVDHVVPLVERDFHVDASRRGVAGSSLGGVASLHALYRYPELFSFAGVFSPAFWWNGDDRWFELVERAPRPRARIYIDTGDDEGDGDEERRRAYVSGLERMSALLRQKGFGDDDLRVVLDRGGIHHESAWARRFPDAMRFLLAP